MTKEEKYIYDFFKNNQEDLLELANTEAGKHLLGADRKETVAGIAPNGYAIFLGKWKGKLHFVSRYNTWNRVAADFMPALFKLRVANKHKKVDSFYKGFLHYSDLLPDSKHFAPIATGAMAAFLAAISVSTPAGVFVPPLGFFLGVDTFTANGGGHGRVYNNSSSTYSTVRNATTGTVDSGSTRPSNSFDNPNYFIGHAHAPFNLDTTIPAGAVIKDTANTFIRATGDGAAVSNADTDSVSVVESSQASNTSLASGDYNDLGTTKLAADLGIGSWSVSGNNDRDLNASGVALIQAAIGGYVKFGWRTAKDISATQPGGRNYVGMVNNTNVLSVDWEVPDNAELYGSRRIHPIAFYGGFKPAAY